MDDTPTILADGNARARSDMRLIRRAARENWAPSSKVKAHAVNRVAELLNHDNPYIALSAANTLVQMDRADIAAQKADAPREQHNTQVNVYMPANTREAAAIEQGKPERLTHAETPSACLPHMGNGEPLDCEIVQVTPAPVAQAH